VSAGYNDICLVIYHLSDYRNEPEIAATWRSFIQETHEEAVAQSETEPHVLVQERVRALGRRVDGSETIFNPRKLSNLAYY
jgi:nuclear pore complex protein Nup155